MQYLLFGFSFFGFLFSVFVCKSFYRWLRLTASPAGDNIKVPVALDNLV